MLTTTVFTAPNYVGICGLDFPFTLDQIVRVPAIKSLHLLCKQSLARGYPAISFPEFDR